MPPVVSSLLALHDIPVIVDNASAVLDGVAVFNFSLTLRVDDISSLNSSTLQCEENGGSESDETLIRAENIG